MRSHGNISRRAELAVQSYRALAYGISHAMSTRSVHFRSRGEDERRLSNLAGWSVQDNVVSAANSVDKASDDDRSPPACD